MSLEVMLWAFKQPIPPAPKIVLLALADKANKQTGVAFQGIELLAEYCVPMKKRTIQNHLKWLSEEAGLITITPRYTESGRQTSNAYQMHMTTTYSGEGAESCTLGDELETGGEGAESCMGRVQKAAPRRVQELLHGEGAAALAPSDKNLDPKDEPKERNAVGARGARRREAVSAHAWEGYRRGYHKRYGIDPVRDATTNTVLCSLVRTFGQEEAAQVAEFYCSLERKIYVENKHPPNLLMRDRFGIRTEMKTGPIRAPVTGPKALQAVPPRDAPGEACPPEVAAKLSRLFGRNFSFSADREGAA